MSKLANLLEVAQQSLNTAKEEATAFENGKKVAATRTRNACMDAIKALKDARVLVQEMKTK
jgi:hypothetical protein